MPGGSETLFLHRLLEDDSSAWREIVSKYSGLLLAIARRTFAAYGFVASEPDCEDAVAEVWRNLLDHDRRIVRQCLERGQLLPTLHVLTRNRAIDQMRRRKFIGASMEELEEVAATDEPESESSLAEELPRALAALSPRERTLVELFYLHDKKYREIEQLTGIPQNSIGPTLTRVLAKLRDTLSEKPEEVYAIPNEPR